MQKTCIKCNHTADVELSATAACPSCGAIYAKVEAQANLDRVRMQRAALEVKQQRAAGAVVVDGEVVRPARSIIETVAWCIAGVAATYGAVEFLYGLHQAESAAQQSAAAAMGAAYAVIPYCLARAIQQFRKG